MIRCRADVAHLERQHGARRPDSKLFAVSAKTPTDLIELWIRTGEHQAAGWCIRPSGLLHVPPAQPVWGRFVLCCCEVGAGWGGDGQPWAWGAGSSGSDPVPMVLCRCSSYADEGWTLGLAERHESQHGKSSPCSSPAVFVLSIRLPGPWRISWNLLPTGCKRFALAWMSPSSARPWELGDLSPCHRWRKRKPRG